MNFADAMRIAGLLPRDILADGKWRRCPTVDHPKKRNGAYILHPDGRGFWRNWATDSDINSWRDDSASLAQRIDPRILEERRARERTQRIAAMRSARDYWTACKPMSSLHPYIANKGLTAQGCAGLRVRGELLVVPVTQGEWVISVQTIAADGAKRFHAGAPVKAGAFLLPRPRAGMTCLVEGLATGLAVYQSVRQASVIVCFDAGNLLPVAQRLKPSGSVVVCADNDHLTQARRGMNPGLEKARNVADYLGCGVAYPVGVEGTDWADALKEWGEGAPRRIEREVMKGVRYVAAPP